MPSAASSRRFATTMSRSPGDRWPSSSSPSFSSSRRSSRCRSSSHGSSRDVPTSRGAHADDVPIEPIRVAYDAVGMVTSGTDDRFPTMATFVDRPLALEGTGSVPSLDSASQDVPLGHCPPGCRGRAKSNPALPLKPPPGRLAGPRRSITSVYLAEVAVSCARHCDRTPARPDKPKSAARPRHPRPP